MVDWTILIIIVIYTLAPIIDRWVAKLGDNDSNGLLARSIQGLINVATILSHVMRSAEADRLLNSLPVIKVNGGDTDSKEE